MPAKTIKILLVDGTPTGLRVAGFGLSSVTGLFAPRSGLSALKNRDEASRTGVYVLLGEDPERPGRPAVYVGQGDDVLRRLIAHNNDATKDFWDRIALFVSTDNTLTATHVRHLEAKLVELAKAAKRATVFNGNEPGGGTITEGDRADMETMLEQMRLLMATTGIDAFEPAPTPPAVDQPANAAPAVEMTMTGEGFSATCVLVDGAFVVKAGSKARISEATIAPTYSALREELKSSGVLKETQGALVFTQDYAFSSVSQAATVVAGYAIPGKSAWRMPNGESYHEWYQRDLG